MSPRRSSTDPARRPAADRLGLVAGPWLFGSLLLLFLPGCSRDRVVDEPALLPELPRCCESFGLDLDEDGTDDFLFEYGGIFTDDLPPSRGGNLLLARALDDNAVQHFPKEGGRPIPDGQPIGAESAWEGYGVSLLWLGWTRADGWEERWEGPWAGVAEGNLGLRLRISGQIHYGWAKLSGSAENGDLRVVDFAFQTIAGLPILAGIRPQAAP